ncbi:MAG: hypothetical protein WC770_09265 [Phycisphaerae bacterium]|jgi:hypothetical protein
MKIQKWQILFGVILIWISAMLYMLHYFIYRDVHQIFFYMLGNVAFLPIEVLLVTLIIHNLLNVREKKSKMAKLNMVVGTFFSDTGAELAGRFYKLDNESGKIQNQLVIKDDWTKENFLSAVRVLRKHEYNLWIDMADLEEWRNYLLGKRKFLMRLLENPNLLEHDNFTDMLWAIFHLTEELIQRKELAGLTQVDINHLAGDMKRAYKAVVFEWIEYMKHLKKSYPYLFSLAMRTNPFNPDASVYVK